jgi:hypothetical protein
MTGSDAIAAVGTSPAEPFGFKAIEVGPGMWRVDLEDERTRVIETFVVRLAVGEEFVADLARALDQRGYFLVDHFSFDCRDGDGDRRYHLGRTRRSTAIAA